MTKGTDPVLEALNEASTPIPVTTIRLLIERSSNDVPAKGTLYRAIDNLEENGYIEEIDWSPVHYEITEKGEEYLESG